jgi:VIT1/CCC1 family predicted Fe2+/Mn2+ transporter
MAKPSDLARYRANLRSGLEGAFSAARQVVFGRAAAAVTFGIGRLLAVTLS